MYDIDLMNCHHVAERDMAMQNPLHPGFNIRKNRLKPLGLNVTEAARPRWLSALRRQDGRVLPAAAHGVGNRMDMGICAGEFS